MLQVIILNHRATKYVQTYKICREFIEKLIATLFLFHLNSPESTWLFEEIKLKDQLEENFSRIENFS